MMTLARAGLVLMLLAALCLAAQADHPPGLETARQRVRQAEAGWAETARCLEAAHYDLAEVRRDHAAVVAVLARAEADLSAAHDALASAERSIPLVQNDLDNLNRRRDQLEPELARAQTDLVASSAELEQARSNALAELRAEEPYQQLLKDLGEAEAELDRITAESLEALARTEQFAIAEKVLEDAELRVESLRAAGSTDQRALAAASQAWIDRQNELNRLKQNWLAMDTKIGAAKHQFGNWQAALRAMDEQIERRLAMRPEVVMAKSAFVSARGEVESLRRERDRTEDAVSAAEEELNRLEAVADQAGHDVAHLRREIERLHPAVRATAAAAAVAVDAVDHASAAEHHARHALDAARRDLAEAERREELVRERERREEQRHRDRPSQDDSRGHDDDRDDGPRRGKRFRQ